jgi:RimJ/RimL family protein N-acetyltransferase
MEMESHFIEGEWLYLRELRPSDVEGNYYRWMNDPEVTRHLESRFFPQSLEDLRNYVKAAQERRDSVLFAIVLKNGLRHIGNIKLGGIHWIHRSADVGLLIGEKDCWGKGYATEAIRLVTAYAFNTLNLRRLVAGCYDANGGSANAFLKAGWKEEGRRESRYFCQGHYCGEILLGIVRP